MTKELSNFQISILILAYKNRLRENRTSLTKTGADLYSHEVLWTVYGFADMRKSDGISIYVDNGQRLAFGRFFNITKIGIKPYNKAYTATNTFAKLGDLRSRVSRVDGA